MESKNHRTIEHMRKETPDLRRSECANQNNFML